MTDYNNAVEHVKAGGKAYRKGWGRGDTLFIDLEDEDIFIDSMKTESKHDMCVRQKWFASKTDKSKADWVLF